MHKPEYIIDIDQGSYEWQTLRKGRIGGSQAQIFAVSGKSESGLGFDAIIKAFEKAGEILFDESPTVYISEAMQHGIDWEPKARADYAEETFQTVHECGYIKFGPYLGYSPDAIIGNDGLLEIKCRSAKEFLRHKLIGRPPSLKYKKAAYCQMQWGLGVTGRKWCDYVEFHPKGGMVIQRVYRDEKLIEKLMDKASIYEILLKSILALYPEKKGYL